MFNTHIEYKDPWGIKMADNWIEVPQLKVNFYMMGMEDADTYYLNLVTENIEYLNQEFEGKVKFESNHIFLDPNKAYLPDLHVDAFTIDEPIISSLVEPIQEEGAINVFLFDTYYLEGTNQALMGFTPILAGRYDTYAKTTPKFDRIFIAYAGLENKTTLVHEVGHFLGLEHPWEMSDINLSMMGLDDHDEMEHNHMTYNQDVSSFTEEQLERMRDFALKFRGYLVDDIDYIAFN